MEQEKAQKEKDCVALDTELGKVSDALSKTSKEKASLEARLNEVTNSLATEEDKANRLGKIKVKLESTLHEVGSLWAVLDILYSHFPTLIDSN